VSHGTVLQPRHSVTTTAQCQNYAQQSHRTVSQPRHSVTTTHSSQTAQCHNHGTVSQPHTAVRQHSVTATAQCHNHTQQSDSTVSETSVTEHLYNNIKPTCCTSNKTEISSTASGFVKRRFVCNDRILRYQSQTAGTNDEALKQPGIERVQACTR